MKFYTLGEQGREAIQVASALINNPLPKRGQDHPPVQRFLCWSEQELHSSGHQHVGVQTQGNSIHIFLRQQTVHLAGVNRSFAERRTFCCPMGPMMHSEC